MHVVSQLLCIRHFCAEQLDEMAYIHGIYARWLTWHCHADCPFDVIQLLLLQVNVVVMRGVNDDEIADFVELTRDHAINVRFIEYMPFDGNVWSDTKMVTYKQMMAAVQQRFPDELQRMQVGNV